ncbi:MAG: GTPase [Candidatus Woesearchaeota archaeon]
MIIQGISKIEKYQFYLDKSIRATEKKARITRNSLKGTRAERSIRMEKGKIRDLAALTASDLESIEKAFPTIDNLPLFYQELIDVTIGKNKLKKSIAGLGWLRKRILTLGKEYSGKVAANPNKARKEFLGRLSSMFKKVKKDFDFLEESRKNIRNFPSFKTGLRTACIAGFPNVGKSTLLTKLTSATPEINVYPFTTKGLMVGYIGKKVQIIDTPGAFRQDVKKMNIIEKQAFLALKYLCSTIIFVIDSTESCGYTISQQEEMLEFILKKIQKETLIYLSKTDLPNNQKEEVRKKYSNFEVFENSIALKKRLKRG